MARALDYQLATESYYKLGPVVQALIRRGYVPHGPAFAHEDSKRWLISQPMVQYEAEPAPDRPVRLIEAEAFLVECLLILEAVRPENDWSRLREFLGVRVTD